MSYPPREIAINFIAIVAGVLTGYLLFLFSGLLGFGILSVTSGPLDDIFYTILYLLLPSFAAGYITAIISTRYDKLNIIITSLSFVLVLDSLFNFTLKNNKDWIFPILIVVISGIGGFIGIYLKKKEKANLNKDSSPPDSSLQ